jgi:hypothetical protein
MASVAASKFVDVSKGLRDLKKVQTKRKHHVRSNNKNVRHSTHVNNNEKPMMLQHYVPALWPKGSICHAIRGETPKFLSR